jgi:LytS/YehU family sensor histidine kinase
MVGILVYLLAVAVHYLIIALDAARDAEVLGMRATVLAREAELRALRAQVDPHFLFNSLNSIGALTADDPQAARRMCLLLAGFLRRSIAIGARDRVTLDEELSLIGDYLAVEQVRFGARLEVRLAIDPDCRACVVPPLLLQPLVENAVRHGIAHLIEGGILAITSRRAPGSIEVRIENPRDPERPTSRGEGVGLANVRGRLQSLYGEAARFDVESRAATFRVTLTLPAATAAGPSATGAPAVGASAGSTPGAGEVRNAASA